MRSEDFEREREDYFERIRGVAEWNGVHRSGTSRFDWDVAYHPAMLRGRRGRRMRTGRRDVLVGVLFLAAVLGIPALVVALTSTPCPRAGVIVALSNLAGVVMITAIFLAYRKTRMRRKVLRPHVHGHHRPHRHD